jgi:uncharacterized membrane protein
LLAIPDPLHPALVHFPIALASIAPLFAFLCAVALFRAWLPARAWLVVVLLQLMLVASAQLALQAGENEEERVEKVVAEERIEEHEEAAERFRNLAVIGLVVVAAGLAPGAIGGWARALAVIVTAVGALASVPVGQSGGELVYKHGAASAYTQPANEAN